ncbi:hypothetical protein EI94DRAFT_1147121 [Lactarius quietus]|nr:hypothetical protein EI94DRAFT_1147121 [Lactarius quietus]
MRSHLSHRTRYLSATISIQELESPDLKFLLLLHSPNPLCSTFNLPANPFPSVRANPYIRDKFSHAIMHASVIAFFVLVASTVSPALSAPIGLLHMSLGTT